MVVTLGPYQSQSRILYHVTRFDQSGSRTVTHPETEFWSHTGLCHARGQNDVILSRSHADRNYFISFTFGGSSRMRNELLTTLKSAIKANMFSYCNNRILSWHLGRQMYSPYCKEPNRLILVFVVAFCVQKDLKISQPIKITFFEIVSLCHVSFHYFRVILFVVVEG